MLTTNAILQSHPSLLPNTNSTQLHSMFSSLLPRSFKWYLDTVYPELFRPDKAQHSGKLVSQASYHTSDTCYTGASSFLTLL